MVDKVQTLINQIPSQRVKRGIQAIASLLLNDDTTHKAIIFGAAATPISIAGAFTTGIEISADGTTGISITSGFTGVNMISLAGTGSTSGIIISGACAIPLNITGAFTTGITLAADGTTGISITSAFTGANMISLAGTGSAAGIAISGACLAGISITGAATDGIKIATGAMTDGIEIASACSANGLNISGVCADGIEISGAATTTGINISADCITGLTIAAQTTAGITIAATVKGIDITGACSDTGIELSGTSTNFAIDISAAQTAVGLGISGACATGILIGGTNTACAINISAIQGAGGDWDAAALIKHGTYSTALAYGAITAGHTVLKSTHVTATVTGHYLMGDLNFLETSGVSTGYFVAGYNYVNVAHTCGAAIGQYVEVDFAGTSEMTGNCQGLFSEVIVNAGSVISGAGKISGATIEVNIVAGATVVQPVYGIEVDMRDIKADIAGQTAGIKITKAGTSNYLDYGILFSNQFENTTAVIGFDLTQGSTPTVMLLDTGAHTTTTFAKFNNTGAGVITNLFDFSGYGSGNGEIIEADAAEATSIYGKLKIIDCSGNAAYINLWSTPN